METGAQHMDLITSYEIIRMVQNTYGLHAPEEKGYNYLQNELLTCCSPAALQIKTCARAVLLCQALPAAPKQQLGQASGTWRARKREFNPISPTEKPPGEGRVRQTLWDPSSQVPWASPKPSEVPLGTANGSCSMGAG